MADINKNIGAGLDIKSIGLLAGAKVLTERASMSYIGNANVKSGLIKLGTALGVSLVVKNKYVRFAMAGVGLDGAEDLIQVGFNQVPSMNKEKSNLNSSGLVAVL
jgi:hypothetical protein